MKQRILDNVKEYSANDLAKYIKAGVVTFDELVHDTDGEFGATKRREVKSLLENGDANEWNKIQAHPSIDAIQYYLDSYPNGQFRDEARALKSKLENETQANELQATINEAWALVDKADKNALNEFINKYPTSTYVNEARKIINTLQYDEIMGVNIDTLVSQINQISTDRTVVTQVQRDNKTIALINGFLNEKKVDKSDFLNKLKDDHNLVSSGVVKQLIDLGTLSIDDLMSIEIDRIFIHKMFNGENAHSFPSPERLERINKQSTEIYFWGIPSSGKSCALGAILSVAANGKVARSMNRDTHSQGYGYMTRLINLFQEGEIGTLMEGTSVDSFYEMGFDLIDKDNKIHPITCIDMAGELMRCMYKYNAGEDMSNTDLVMLNTLTKVLIDNRSTNRKMHIFVIEYGAEDKLYEGLPQRVYLEGAVSYINDTGIFKKDTDAIYIMITKTDKIKNANQDTITQYINDKYLGFYNGLEQICMDNGINRGRVEKIAFSLGEVCFQNYCKFNSRPAENVVKLILQRSASDRKGKRGMFAKILRG